MKDLFRKFSIAMANALGAPWMFIANVLLILVWAGAGPFFGYSDTWQLIINTATTVFTYLAVFLIQNTQNRDAEAMQVKLDELIHVMKGAQNALLDLEELEDEELDRIRAEYQKIAERARGELRKPRDKNRSN